MSKGPRSTPGWEGIVPQGTDEEQIEIEIETFDGDTVEELQAPVSITEKRDRHGRIVVKMDNSMAKALVECTTEGMLRYRLGYESVDPKPAAEAGSAIHAGLAAYLKAIGEGKEPGLARKHGTDALVAYYTPRVKEFGLERGDRLELENVLRVLQVWMQTHPKEQLPFVVLPDCLEIKMVYPLGIVPLAGETYRIVLTGVLDGVVRNRLDHSLYALEHKTTGQLTGFWTKQWKHASQVTGYVVGAEHMVGEPVVGAFVNAIEVGKIPSAKTRKCAEHGVMYAECGPRHCKTELIPTTRGPEQREAWKNTMLAVATQYIVQSREVQTLADIPGLPQEGTIHNACSLCEFGSYCLSGRQPWAAASLLRYRPWWVVQ